MTDERRLRARLASSFYTVEADNAAPTTAPTNKPKTGLRILKKPEKRQITQSSVSFPYMDLETGIAVAQAIMGAGGVPLSREQLAGVMKMAVGSGTFITKTATARTFGLIATVQGKYELTNLGFAIIDKDENTQRAARAEGRGARRLHQRGPGETDPEIATAADEGRFGPGLILTD